MLICPWIFFLFVSMNLQQNNTYNIVIGIALVYRYMPLETVQFTNIKLMAKVFWWKPIFFLFLQLTGLNQIFYNLIFIFCFICKIAVNVCAYLHCHIFNLFSLNMHALLIYIISSLVFSKSHLFNFCLSHFLQPLCIDVI